MQETPSIARQYFSKRFNCAQSIFGTFAERLGISTEIAMRLAAPFGGGIAREGHVCGALTGALMVLGLQYSDGRPEGKEEIYRIAREFVENFERRHGTILCKDLLGYDISTSEGLQRARADHVFDRVCPLLVDTTANALIRYINDHSPAEA